MDFKNPEALSSFHKDVTGAAFPQRAQNVRSTTQSQCYYMGLQWWMNNIAYGWQNSGTNGAGRLLSDMNPDSAKLRVTVNRVYKNVNKAAAATWPSNIEVDAIQSDADPGVEAAFKTQVIEMAANIGIDYGGMLEACRDANFNRCIAGSWGFGWYLSNEVREVEGQQIPDKCLRAFEFDPNRLILDPSNKNRNLCDHEYVVYEDAWTLEKIRRTLGLTLDPDKCKTIGVLMGNELMMNSISQNNLYGQYKLHSNTKGAMVCQSHFRDGSGRFSRMYVSVRTEDGEYKPINFDDPSTPYGGVGMPLFLLHGQRRPGSMWSIAEGQATKDDQDRINLLMSFYFRWLQSSAGKQWLVDKRNFKTGTSDEDVRKQFSNRNGGMVVYTAQSDKVPQPHLVQHPAPPQHLMNDAGQFEADMQQQAFRAPANFGLGAKSHVPDATNQRLLDEGDQILGIRVKEDAAAYAAAVRCLIGTTIKLVKDQNPGTLVGLRSRGFGEDEFAAILQSDPYDIGCTIIVRESSVRFRSIQARQQSLDKAAELKFIGPMDYRMEVAGLDVPLTSSDDRMFTSIRKRVNRLLMGQPWAPLPLGEYNQTALKELQMALFDKRAEADPAIQKMVTEAIVLQMQAEAMQQQLMTPDEPEQAGQPQPVVGEQQPDTLGGILSMMDSGMGQPGSPDVPQAA